MLSSLFVNLLIFLFSAGLILNIVPFSIATYSADQGSPYPIDRYVLEAWLPMALGQLMMLVSAYFLLTQYIEDDRIRTYTLGILAVFAIGQASWATHFSVVRQRFAAG